MRKPLSYLCAFVFLFSTSFVTKSLKEGEGDGVYKTYEDFLKNNLTDYGAFEESTYKDVIFRKDGEKIKCHKKDIWGYKRNWGIDKYNIYRSVQSGGHEMAVLQNGGIWLYVSNYAYVFFREKEASANLLYVKKAEGEIVRWEIQMAFTQEAVEHTINLSKSGDGEILKSTLENIEQLLADDSEILQEFKTNYKYPHKQMDYQNNFNQLCEIVKKYNEKHK